MRVLRRLRLALRSAIVLNKISDVPPSARQVLQDHFFHVVEYHKGLCINLRRRLHAAARLPRARQRLRRAPRRTYYGGRAPRRFARAQRRRALHASAEAASGSRSGSAGPSSWPASSHKRTQPDQAASSARSQVSRRPSAALPSDACARTCGARERLPPMPIRVTVRLSAECGCAAPP